MLTLAVYVSSAETSTRIPETAPGIAVLPILEAQPPLHLRIPKINVDAEIETTQLTPDGALGVPEDRVHAAWFSLGPRPGEVGDAIITGHFGWKDDLPAVFNDLHTLQVGDKVYLENTAGISTTFIVRQLRTYDEHAESGALFALSDNKAHLNLVTCAGVWNKAEKSYSKRLVVFTDKE